MHPFRDSPVCLNSSTPSWTPPIKPPRRSVSTSSGGPALSHLSFLLIPRIFGRSDFGTTPLNSLCTCSWLDHLSPLVESAALALGRTESSFPENAFPYWEFLGIYMTALDPFLLRLDSWRQTERSCWRVTLATSSIRLEIEPRRLQ